MTEFVENSGNEAMEKQDCERKACWRLMKKLKMEFPKLSLCVHADSLYACERFFCECRKKGRNYILRVKEGSIPYVAEDGRKLWRRVNQSREQRHRRILESFKEDRLREMVGVGAAGILLPLDRKTGRKRKTAIKNT